MFGFDFLTKELGTRLLGLVVIVALLFAGWSWARSTGYEAGYKDAMEAAAESQQELQSRFDALSSDHATLKREYEDYVAAQSKYLEAYKEHASKVIDDLTTKVKVFKDEQTRLKKELGNVESWVSREADARCSLSRGAVGLHNASADPTITVGPIGPPGDADAPGQVALSTYVATVRDNYATCNRWRHQVELWQSWYVDWQKWHTEYEALLSK